MGFLKCILYISVLGLASFFLGRVVPAAWFREDRFPYQSWAWEQEGNFYLHFGIRKWQAKVPDMSKILPKLIPAKKVGANFDAELPRMITETCIAEWIHVLLCPLALPCLWLWPGRGGVIFVTVYILVNIPFIMIQRYNRPRFIRIRDKKARINGKKEQQV